MADASPWATVVAGVLGTAIGAGAGLVGGWLTDMRARESGRKRATSALAAEVHGLLTIVRVRRYRESVVQVVEAFASGRLTEPFQFEVSVPEHYSRVYQAHIDKLGDLNVDHASDLIEFHQLLDSIVQDVSPGGLVAKYGGNREAFEQLLELFDAALAAGKRFVERARDV